MGVSSTGPDVGYSRVSLFPGMGYPQPGQDGGAPWWGMPVHVWGTPARSGLGGYPILGTPSQVRTGGCPMMGYPHWGVASVISDVRTTSIYECILSVRSNGLPLPQSNVIFCFESLVLSARMYVLTFQDQHILHKWNILSLLVQTREKPVEFKQLDRIFHLWRVCWSWKANTYIRAERTRLSRQNITLDCCGGIPWELSSYKIRLLAISKQAIMIHGYGSKWNWKLFAGVWVPSVLWGDKIKSSFHAFHSFFVWWRHGNVTFRLWKELWRVPQYSSMSHFHAVFIMHKGRTDKFWRNADEVWYTDLHNYGEAFIYNSVFPRPGMG